MGKSSHATERKGQGAFTPTPKILVRGFTLLELMMVVIIIAILASIALPQYIKATERSRATEVLGFLGNIRAAEQRYKAQSLSNQYTGVLAELDSFDTSATAQVPFAFNNLVTVPTGVVLAAKGMASYTRNNGTYSGQTVSLTYTNGVGCGTFIPLYGAAVVCPNAGAGD